MSSPKLVNLNSHSCAMLTHRLCEICNQIDITRTGLHSVKIENRYHADDDDSDETLNESFDPSNSPPQALGCVKDIAARRSICDLCSLILAPECVDLDRDAEALCELIDVWLCKFDTIHDNIRYGNWIYGLSIRLYPSGTENLVNGPYLPNFISSDASQQPRSVLELQIYDAKQKSLSGHPSHSREVSSVGRLVANEVCFDVLRQWPDRCMEMHASCHSDSDRSIESATPALTLIDVRNGCLVKSLPYYKYVALSYVWGATTVKVHKALSKGQDLYHAKALNDLDLPATIQDAITVVQRIGERYLWIDALCIPQNDLSARAEQISQMYLIYLQAYFTIIAAAGVDADHGLPGVRPGTRQTAQKTVNLGDTAFLTFIDNANCDALDGSTWRQRAWTLQEDIFSKRRIGWTEKQVYRVCPEAEWLEECAIENLDTKSLKRPRLQQPLSRLIEKSDISPSHRLWRDRDQLRYIDLRNAFLERNNTHSSDMLNAFSGVMRALALENETHFVFGLPEIFFSASLFWAMPDRPRNYGSERMKMDDGTLKDIYFPSWGWAAWQVALQPFGAYWTTGGDFTATNPALTFYHSSVPDDRWREIRERDVVPDHPTPHAQHWMSSPRTIRAGELVTFKADSKDIGCLKFWTSTSTAYVTAEPHRRRLSMDGYAFENTTLLERTEVQDSYSIAKLDELMEQDPRNRHHFFFIPGDRNGYRPLSDENEVIKKEVMVIAIGQYGSLMCMLFDRKDGIAYRAGIAWVREYDWIEMKRQWHLITVR